MTFTIRTSFLFILAIAIFWGMGACAKREPYRPVVQVSDGDKFYEAVHIGEVTGDYSMESVFPVESEREFMARFVNRSGGIEPDTRSWFADFLYGNKLYSREKTAAKYLLNVAIEKYWVGSTPQGIGYETDFSYTLVSAADGRVLYEERVTDSGTRPYDIAWGAMIGSAVGQGVAAGITGSSTIGQRPAGISGDTVQISILKTYQLVIKANIEQFLPRMRAGASADAAG